MICFDKSIRKCKKELAALYARKHEIEAEREDIVVLPGSEIETLIQKIDALVEGEYSRAVYSYYSVKEPLLIRIHTGEEVKWLDAFGSDYEKTTPGQRQALVGLVEGGSMYKFK